MSMDVRIEFDEKKAFKAYSRNHIIPIDLSKDKGGDDSGMTPLELFLISLGSCVGVYAKIYSEKAEIDLRGAEINISADLSNDKPLRLTNIIIKLHLPSDVGDKAAGLKSFISNCPIHNTLHSNEKVRFEISK